MMAAVIIAAAVFLGVLNESGMLESVALSMLQAIPEGVGQYLHVIVGVLGVPLDMLTSTDAYYSSVLPLVEATASQFGVAATSTAYALLLGNMIGTSVSPFAPAVWLAMGLAAADVGKHIRYSFLIIWGLSIALLLVAILNGHLRCLATTPATFPLTALRCGWCADDAVIKDKEAIRV